MIRVCLRYALDPAVRTYIGDIRCRIRGLRPTPAKGTLVDAVPHFVGIHKAKKQKDLKIIIRMLK